MRLIRAAGAIMVRASAARHLQSLTDRSNALLGVTLLPPIRQTHNHELRPERRSTESTEKESAP